MTFYHVLFAILFVGAIKVFNAAMGAWGTTHAESAILAESIVLMILIFCDMIFTADALEERKLHYTWKLKLIDGLDFILLLVSLLIIGGDTKFEFMENPPFKFLGWQPPTYGFWALICLYFLTLNWWNLSAGTYKLDPLGKRKKLCVSCQVGMAVIAMIIFLVQLYWARGAMRCSDGTRWLSWLYVLLAVAYFIHKMWVMNKLEEHVKVIKAQTAGH